MPAAERASDPHGDEAAAFAVESLADPRAFLELAQVFTPAVRESDRFRAAFVQASNTLAAQGSIGALEILLDASA
ncbi:MAG: hypothetical protein ABI990_05580 [Actinomycetota bacterium]